MNPDEQLLNLVLQTGKHPSELGQQLTDRVSQAQPMFNSLDQAETQANVVPQMGNTFQNEAQGLGQMGQNMGNINAAGGQITASKNDLPSIINTITGLNSGQNQLNSTLAGLYGGTSQAQMNAATTPRLASIAAGPQYSRTAFNVEQYNNTLDALKKQYNQNLNYAAGHGPNAVSIVSQGGVLTPKNSVANILTGLYDPLGTYGQTASPAYGSQLNNDKNIILTDGNGNPINPINYIQ